MSPESTPDDQTPGGGVDAPRGGGLWKKLAFLVGFSAAVVTGYVLFGDSLSFEEIARHEAKLREYRETAPVLVYGAAFVLYVAVTGLSLPGAAVLSLVYAWYFGFWAGVVLVSFASTSGATLAFLSSRYVLGSTIQRKFGDRLTAFNKALERDGALYLFTLRLIPAVPFFVINLVMGLTRISVATFWWVSQVGMLPGTAVYVYAGSRVPDLQTLKEQGAKGIFTVDVIIAFVVLGLFPFAVKFIMKLVRPREVEHAESVESDGEAEKPERTRGPK